MPIDHNFREIGFEIICQHNYLLHKQLRDKKKTVLNFFNQISSCFPLVSGRVITTIAAATANTDTVIRERPYPYIPAT